MRTKYHIHEAVLALYVTVPNSFAAYVIWVIAVEGIVTGTRETVVTVTLALANILPLIAVVGEFVGWKRSILIILYVLSGLMWIATYCSWNLLFNVD